MSARYDGHHDFADSGYGSQRSHIVHNNFKGSPHRSRSYGNYTKIISVASDEEEGAEMPDRDRHATNTTKKKKKKTTATRKTYRVRGFLPTADKETVKTSLHDKLNVENIEIHSFCDDCSRTPGKVATVEFKSTTPEFLLAEAEENEWPFEYDEHTLLTFDSHFTGFTPLYSPENPSDYEMDFIAIHGLGGHPLGSWKDRHSSHVWLRDALCHDFPRCRILIYGYLTKVVDSESFETIPEIAAHFCDLLLDTRIAEASRKKPIIFAAHSLGGLVLKSAIGRMANEGADERLCLRSTHSILCFGVPNQGMATSHMLAMIKGQENLPLVTSLSKDPQSLEPINKAFNKAFPFEDSHVISFYETQISPTMQQGHDGKPEMTGERVVLVDSFSANNSRKNREEPRININRNHSNMVKFKARDDLYPIVLRQLEKLVPKASEVIERRHSETSDSSNLDPTDAETRARSASPVSSNGDGNNLPFSSTGPAPLMLDPAQIEAKQKDYEKTIHVLEMLNVARLPMSTKEEREEALIWAVELGHIDSVEYILDRRTDPDTQTEENMTMLGIAAKNGHAQLVQLLLRYKANINLKDRQSRTPLFFAAGYGHIQIVKDLIRGGAFLQTKHYPRAKPKDYDMTPLMNAARFGQIEVLNYLIDEGAEVDARTREGKYSALHYAVISSKLNAIEALLERGADVDLRTALQTTALILASTYCSRDEDQLIAQSLIKAGANINAQEDLGYTALHYAVSLGNLDLCRLLVSEGAKLSIKGPHGLTVFHIAIYQGNQRIVDTLYSVLASDYGDYTDSIDARSESSSTQLDSSEMLDDNGFAPHQLNKSGVRLPPSSIGSSRTSTSSSTTSSKRTRRSRRKRRSSRRQGNAHDDDFHGETHIVVGIVEEYTEPQQIRLIESGENQSDGFDWQ